MIKTRIKNIIKNITSTLSVVCVLCLLIYFVFDFFLIRSKSSDVNESFKIVESLFFSMTVILIGIYLALVFSEKE